MPKKTLPVQLPDVQTPRLKRKALPIQLSESERLNLEKLAFVWDLSLSAAVRRLILENAIG